MINKMEQFIEDIEKEILNRSFLKKYGFERKVIDEFLLGDHFLHMVHEIIEKEQFHSKMVFEMVAPLIERSFYGTPPEHWLSYFYNYALYFSFPDAVTTQLTASYNRIAELYLRVLKVVCQYQKKSNDGTWQSRYALELLTDAEVLELEDSKEFLTFKKYFNNEYVYEMMKLNQEVIGFTTLDHICGVHFLAMRIARQLKYAGFPIDLGRVSGAAAGHDIGKFGCKQEEMKRVAYFHYFYTGEWFEKRDIIYIRNVALNHSTWDLELEALPIESLILIYSDFRVKAEKVNGKSVMMYFNLKASFDVILDKLDNVDAAKEDRYRKVYRKLSDFEHFLLDLGIQVSPDSDQLLGPNCIQKRKYFSLMQGKEITENVIHSSIEHNINLLYRLRDEASLNKLLEPVRNSRDMTKLRGYISILEEYYNYLTQKQKQIMINFLYEKLILPEEDIRKQCAELIGTIIASYDEEIRKEIPPSVTLVETEVDTVRLFDIFVERFLLPENQIIDRHKKYISYSLRDMIDSYFKHLKIKRSREKSIALIVQYFKAFDQDDKIRFYLVKAARILPFKEFDESQKATILKFVSRLLTNDDLKLRLRAFNLIYTLISYANDDLLKSCDVYRIFKEPFKSANSPAENYARLKLGEHLKLEPDRINSLKEICLNDLQYTSNIFLSNLKSATLDIEKRFQIELLIRNTLLYDYDNCFYMAMHLCNLLKVSALESVRNTAGRMLLELISHLNFEQKNDIAIELIRALEMESYEFTKYIPPYLGKILLHIKPKELDEILESFERKMSTSNSGLISLIEKTIGVSITKYADYKYAFKEEADGHNRRVLRMYGILFTGFVHSSSHVNQMAFSVIAKDIFQDQFLSLRKREYLYKLIIKKIMSLMVNTDEDLDLIFFNNSSCLKYIYQFISEFQHEYGDIELKPNKKIAFFPGAFDPFTLSHKQIAMDIKEKGFEVLLYVDEFSWSKRTQPNLIRRNIIKRSVASEIEVYPFPRDISINIANNEDLDKLVSLFPDSEIYLVVGSDVVMNASAYSSGKVSKIFEIPHVIYQRGGLELSQEETERLNDKISKLHPNTVKVLLPKEYESISSTLIRDYIDEKRDISSLIDPLAQNYIYEKGLYQREPMYKSVMTTKSLVLELLEEPNLMVIESLASISGIEFPEAYQKLKDISGMLNFRMLILRSLEKNNEIVAYSLFHWLRATNIHNEFEDPAIINFIRDHSVGRIIVIDSIVKKKNCEIKNLEQIMMTETLANALSRDYTYCVYKESIRHQVSREISEILLDQGFINISSSKTNEMVYAVNMSSPCTVNLDIHSMFKEPYKHIPEVVQVMNKTRSRLQKAFTELYPGNLVLNFDRSMIYETLIKKVCDENNMPTTPLVPKQVGEAMCVPFGAIFKRWILPNTVTKTLHAEKYFSTDLTEHRIMEYPFYLDIANQIKMIKSFNRPLILVDDLLNKGYRIKALQPHFKKENVEIQKFIVGIMSGSGKEIAERMNINVDAAYFIPKIKVWFYESKLYPFIDGDAIWRGSIPESNLINSVNLILPYSSANYIVGASKASIYNLSEVALLNSIDIMSAVELAYESQNDRLLTIDRLGEVLNTPRYPDKGKHIFYSNNIRPSEYLKDDLEQLRKLKSFYL
ncbi:cytidyltransferase [Fusibacter ferrireducens]|uniref:nicotinate-nucleotide adenylyltransferase n=1 Tax=Fusibacter ferrireducens TaxID=2785058 RepID=A0ABR9ZQP2_9FIRM|nr:cytidyltransferase [Fusibacter ferrireducens]MBF4692777.1 cytidyltransferase [Fusibacter ferrireducens]